MWVLNKIWCVNITLRSHNPLQITLKRSFFCKFFCTQSVIILNYPENMPFLTDTSLVPKHVCAYSKINLTLRDGLISNIDKSKLIYPNTFSGSKNCNTFAYTCFYITVLGLALINAFRCIGFHLQTWKSDLPQRPHFKIMIYHTLVAYKLWF